jgi:hypothetical protein
MHNTHKQAIMLVNKRINKMEYDVDEYEVMHKIIFGRTCAMIMAEAVNLGVDVYSDFTTTELYPKSKDHPLYKEYWQQMDKEIDYDTSTVPGAWQDEYGRWWLKEEPH